MICISLIESRLVYFSREFMSLSILLAPPWAAFWKLINLKKSLEPLQHVTICSRNIAVFICHITSKHIIFSLIYRKKANVNLWSIFLKGEHQQKKFFRHRKVAGDVHKERRFFRRFDDSFRWFPGNSMIPSKSIWQDRDALHKRTPKRDVNS